MGGDRTPQGKRNRVIRVVVTEDIEEAIRDAADEDGTSVSSYAARIIAEDLGFGSFERDYRRRDLVRDELHRELEEEAGIEDDREDAF